MADTDPEGLERRIERTRAELAVTVDAIADRVSPRRVAERQVARVKANAEHLVATARDMLGGVTHPAEPGAEDGRPGERPPASLAPVLIGVGAVVVLGATIMLWRRRRR
ncbi:hypothetical protein Sru01_00380 [Sphaerisporangium rufum]|uniref:DUF3618 domain-containing protein n=1 Tax=Sphaerisporangium rufum TaxID=1381558 RepID=A0A919UVH1_9ACTN|nr:DUF3618 domain-containing protein [Sphaerisporangium rufum]GII75056.1 hypothetical protein Sru01_00380 [Sphaerisporangium rufum]